MPSAASALKRAVKVAALPALFDDRSVLQQHLFVAALTGAFEDLESPVEFPISIHVAVAVLFDECEVVLRKPGVSGQVIVGANVGRSSLDPASDGVGVDVSVILFGDAGDVAVRAVAFGYGSEDGDEVLGGELADAFSRYGHRVLQCITWRTSPEWEGSVLRWNVKKPSTRLVDGGYGKRLAAGVGTAGLDLRKIEHLPGWDVRDCPSVGRRWRVYRFLFLPRQLFP